MAMIIDILFELEMYGTKAALSWATNNLFNATVTVDHQKFVAYEGLLIH